MPAFKPLTSNRSSFLVIAVALPWFTSSGLAAMDLAEYMRLYMQSNARITQAKLEETQVNYHLSSSENRYKTTAIAIPYYNKTDSIRDIITLNDPEDDPRQDFNTNKSLGYTFDLNQSLPWGSTVGLRASMIKLQELGGDKYDPSKNYSVYYNQELARNWLGAFGDQEIQRLRGQSQAKNEATKSIAMQECIRGSNLYIQAFVNHEQVAIMHEIDANTLKMLQFMQKKYENGQTSRLQYLAAKDDALTTKARKQFLQKELNTATYALTGKIGTVTTKALQNPAAHFEKIPLAKTDFAISKSPEVAALIKMKESANVEVAMARERTKPQIALNVEAGRKTTTSRFPWGRYAMQTIFQDDFIQLGFTLNLPIYNRSPAYDVLNAASRAAHIDSSLQELQHELQTLLKSEVEGLAVLFESRQLKVENIELAIRQREEALKLLQGGRLDFEDYRRFRDKEWMQRMDYWNINREIWFTTLKIAGLSNEWPDFCPQTAGSS